MERLSSNHYQMVYDRTSRALMPDVLQMDVFNALSAQLAAMSKKIQIPENQSQVRSQFGQIMRCEL